MIDNFKVNALKEQVSAVFDKKTNSYRSDDVIQAELDWNYSLFVALFLSKSIPSLQLNRSTLEKEVSEYNQKYSAAITIEALQGKQWIRFIFGNVEIPRALFWFCKDIKAKQDIDEKYLSFFEELRFIGVLYTKYGYSDSRPFKILKKDFAEIYNRFSFLYPKLPAKEKMLEMFKFKESSEVYLYKPFYFRSACSSKIAAHLWNLLDNVDIEEKIKKWLILLQQFFINDVLNCLPTNQSFLYSENIINLLLQESDVVYEPKVELNKVFTDSHNIGHSDIEIFFKQDINDFHYPDTDNYLLLWNSFDRNFYIDIYSQECREQYSKILFSVLNVTDERSVKYISKILSAEKKVPFLFFQTIFYLERNNVALLLNFIDEKDYGVIFYFEFIKKCFEELNNPQKKIMYSTIINILRDSVDLLIATNVKKNNTEIEQFIYILIYFIRFRFSTDRREFLQKKKRELYIYAIEKLGEFFKSKELISKQSELINLFFHIKDDFLPVCNYQDSIGIKQFAFLFNLIKFNGMVDNSANQIKLFDRMEQLYIQDFLKSEKMFCIDEYVQIEDFQWNKLINYLEESNRLESFCLSIFNYLNFSDSEKDDYDQLRTNADKLRLHLKILCISYQQNFSVCRVSERLESYILKILSHSFTDDKELKKISIFSSLYENHFIGEVNTSIFPLVITIMNNCSAENRNNFLSLLENEGNFPLLFKTYNLLAHSDDKKNLEKFIKSKDFSNRLEEIYSVPDFITVATDVINSRLNDSFSALIVNQLIKIMRDKANTGYISQYTYITEELKLYQLYKNNDKDSVLNYVFPYEDKTQQFKTFYNNLIAEKLFYLALFDLDDKKDSACKKLKKLCLDYPENLKYRMYLIYVEACDCEGNEKSSIRKKYLKEIDELLEKDIVNKGVLLITKLHLLVLDGQIEKAVLFFDSLDYEYKIDISFVQILIVPLLEEGMYKKAVEFFHNIDSTFYEDAEYRKLQKLITTDDYLVTLKQNYSEILNLSDEERYKVLPNKINKHCNDLGLYILNEINIALNKTLKKIDLIKKNDRANLSEDNISDLLELEINARLSMLDYKLENQDRSGVSLSRINAGEIDLEINFNDFSIIIEAVKFSSGPAKRKQHIEKTFNYDPSKKFIYDLIYYDETGTFEDAWINMLEDIKNASYPKGYEIESIEDMQSNNAGIKMVKSQHNNGLIFYHIMGNFRYTET